MMMRERGTVMEMGFVEAHCWMNGREKGMHEGGSLFMSKFCGRPVRSLQIP